VVLGDRRMEREGRGGVPIIKVTLAAHQTTTLTSCNGTS